MVLVEGLEFLILRDLSSSHGLGQWSSNIFAHIPLNDLLKNDDSMNIISQYLKFCIFYLNNSKRDLKYAVKLTVLK